MDKLIQEQARRQRRPRFELVSLEGGCEHRKLLVEWNRVERGHGLGILDHIPDEGELEPGQVARRDSDLHGGFRDRHRNGILAFEFLRNAYHPRLRWGKWRGPIASRILLLMDKVVVGIVK